MWAVWPHYATQTGTSGPRSDSDTDLSCAPPDAKRDVRPLPRHMPDGRIASRQPPAPRATALPARAFGLLQRRYLLLELEQRDLLLQRRKGTRATSRRWCRRLGRREGPHRVVDNGST